LRLNVTPYVEAKAVDQAGITLKIFDHFMVSDHSVPGEAWPLVEKALEVPAGDVCATKLFSEQPLHSCAV